MCTPDVAVPQFAPSPPGAGSIESVPICPTAGSGHASDTGAGALSTHGSFPCPVITVSPTSGRADVQKEAHMGAQRTSFEKLQRDRARKAKQAMKREKRLSGDDSPDEAPTVELTTEGELSAAELLAQIELIHKQLEDKVISFDEFEERKIDLMARLPID